MDPPPPCSNSTTAPELARNTHIGLPIKTRSRRHRQSRVRERSPPAPTSSHTHGRSGHPDSRSCH
eukprot:10926835-Alexandrium_andersonii.AAC.1